MLSNLLDHKTQEARDLVRRCFGSRGLWASPDRYRRQCWTRDAALCQPALFLDPDLAGDGPAVAERHLRELAARLRGTHGDLWGKQCAPILFLDGPLGHAEFLLGKVRRSLQLGRPSFMLRRYLAGKLWQLTPGTRDSEVMFLHMLLEHCSLAASDALRAELDSHVSALVNFIESCRMDRIWPREKTLVASCDWRDTMEQELGGKTLLGLNSVWHSVLRRLGMNPWADEVRGKLRARVDERGWLLDYEGATRFDPFGAAMAVLYDVALPEDYSGVLEGLASVDSPAGVTIQCRHNAYGDTAAEVAAERAEIERTDGVVTWPFIGWLAVSACRKMAHRGDLGVVRAAAQFAEEQERKLLNLDGFREWYSPDTGKGWGARDQLWSAAMLLRARYEHGRH